MTAKAARRPRIVVDPRLHQLAYRCYPDGCPADRTCCVGLAVSVSRRERKVVEARFDELARYVPRLRRSGGYADVFDEDGGDTVIEPCNDEGQCPFLYRARGRALCSIHSVAIAHAEPVEAVKPRACRHWPLVVETSGRGALITVHPDALEIGCVATRDQLPAQPSMAEAFAAEIDELARLLRGGR